MAAPRHPGNLTGPSRRSVLVSVAAAALAAPLAACAPSSDPTTSSASSSSSSRGASGGDVTLQFWTWSLKGTDPKAQAIIAQYEKENPGVKIQLSEVGGTADSSSKLLAADRAGDVPDIVQCEYRGLASLVTAGVVKDITSAVAAQRSGIDQNIWNLASLNNQVYGVPQDIGPMMLTYRADLFQQYGVTPPATWQDYTTAAEKIRKADSSAYIAAFAPDQFEFFAAHAAQAGGKWWSTDGKAWTVGIDDSPTQQIAAYWQDLVDRDLVSVQPLLTPEYNAQINAGKLLSWAAAAWAPSVLYSVAPQTAGKWAASPLPQWNAGNASVPFLGGSAYLIPQKSKNAAAAATFAAWLGASDEGSKLLLSLDLYPAGNGGRSATLTQAPPQLMPQQTDFYKVADQVIQDTTISVQWGPDVNVAQSTFGDAMSAAAKNKTSFNDVFATTQSAVVADLKKSGYTVAS